MKVAILAASAYGVTVVIGRDLAAAGIDGPAALGPRFVISAVILAAVQMARRRPLVPPRRDIAAVFALGAIGYSLESSLFYAALGEGTAAAVAVLFYCYPAIVATVEIAAGRARRSARLAAAMLLTIGGAFLVVTAGSEIDISTKGVALALGSATAFTLYLLLGSRVGAGTDAVTKAMWVAGGTGLSQVVRGAVTGAELPQSSRTAEILVYAAANAAAFALTFVALGRIGATRTAVVLTFELVAAVLLAALLLDEAVGPIEVVGGLAVLAGAVVVTALPSDAFESADELAPP